MNRYFTVVIVIILGGINLSAQDFDSYKRQKQEAFRSFQQKNQEQWDAYRRNANADYAEYLGKPWESKKGEKPRRDTKQEPDITPVVLPDIGWDIQEDNPLDVDITIPELEVEPIPVAPIPYRPKDTEKTLPFVFYGTKCNIRFDTGKIVSLSGTDENAVSRFWRQLSEEAYDNIVADCLKIKEDRDLCDWAYFKMTEKVSETIYSSRNERAVFHSWLLTQSGFSTRLGRDKSQIHLLVETTSLIFGKPFWRLKNGMFFLLDGTSPEEMNIMDVKFPKTSPLRMSMDARNFLDKNSASARKLYAKKYLDVGGLVACDKNLLAFFADVPVSAVDKSSDATDFVRYAQMPLSKTVVENLYPSLRKQLTGKTEMDAANILLNFVQTAFEYKTDAEVWGYERPFFPEETLYYPFSDCEDRSILFCRMVKDLMGLDVAFVSYPGHLATAVKFNQKIPGDYFLVNGTRYLVCDPTYINAPVGRTMPGMDSTRAKVYLFK